ncbi:transposase [uncultured Carboxylicivirga sp.]|uniref:transposase n=1 Tax=Carboxylicivirga sp. M1479 TaxID=2594476 RepID=UPI00344D0824
MQVRSRPDEDPTKHQRSTEESLEFNLCDTNQIIIKRDLIQDAFTTIRRTFEAHRDTIINYFNGRSTNAAAESFNAKIKEFRRQFRGVSDVKFFLYRLCKIYA